MLSKKELEEITDRYLANINEVEKGKGKIIPEFCPISMNTEPREYLIKGRIEDFCIDLGAEFFRFRCHKNLTQKQMAKELKLSPQEYVDLENGEADELELSKILNAIFYFGGKVLVNIPWLDHLD